MENKAGVVSGGGTSLMQLSNYLNSLDENGGYLDHNFFTNPLGGEVGPNIRFALALAEAAIRYDVGISIYDDGWWDYAMKTRLCKTQQLD